jgi:hypothetical protein
MIALLRQAADAGSDEGRHWEEMRTHRISSPIMTSPGYSAIETDAGLTGVKGRDNYSGSRCRTVSRFAANLALRNDTLHVCDLR